MTVGRPDNVNDWADEPVQTFDGVTCTSPDNTPDRIARLLLAEGLGDAFQMAVAERLSSADEQVQIGRAHV